MSDASRLIQAFSDEPARMTLARLVCVAIRYASAVSEPQTTRRKFVNAVLGTLRSGMSCASGISSLTGLARLMAEAAAGVLGKLSLTLFRMQLFQAASQRISEAVNDMRGALVAAAMGAAPADGAASDPTANLPAPAAAAVAAAIRRGYTPASSLAAIQYVCQLMDVLCLFVTLPPALESGEPRIWLAFSTSLAHSLQRSAFLEHASQAMVVAVLLLKVPAVEAAGAARENEIFSDLMIAQERISHMFSRLRLLEHENGTGSPFCAPLRAVLAGPCLQHLVIAWGITALHSADGGTVYGLEPCLQRHLPVASLPPGFWGVPDELHDATPLPVIAAPALSHMLPALELYANEGNPLPGWRASIALALRVAAAALNSAAMWVKIEEDAERGEVPADAAGMRAAVITRAAAAIPRGAAAPAAGEVSQARRRRPGLAAPLTTGPQQPNTLMPRDTVVDMCVGALRTAFRIQAHRAPPPDGGVDRHADFAAAVAAERWQMAMAVVDYALRWRGGEAGFDGLGELLVNAVPDRLTARVAILPPTPPPEVAAALDAGLLPCLERLIRVGSRNPASKEAQLAANFLQLDLSFLMGHLLVYGEQREASALLGTLRKLRRRHFAAGHAQHAVSALPQLLKLKDAMLQAVGMAMSEGKAWMIAGAAAEAYDAALGGVAVGAVNAAITAASDAVVDVVDEADDYGSAGGATAAAAPVGAGAAAVAIADTAVTPAIQQRLGWVMTQILHDWLPAMVEHVAAPYVLRALKDAAAAGSYRPYLQAFIWPCVASVQLLSYGLPEGKRAAAPTAAAAAAADGGDGGCWQRRVLSGANVVHLLGTALRFSEDERWQRMLSGPLGLDAGMRVRLADSLCRVAAAYPGKVREAAIPGAAAAAQATVAAGRAARGAGRGSRGGRGGDGRRQAGAAGGRGGDAAGADAVPTEDVTKVTYWPPGLVRSLATRVHSDWPGQTQGPLATALEALAAQLEVWADGGPEEVAEGPLGAVLPLPSNPIIAAMADLLTAPDDVPGQMRCCANPACVNLEGDSEAGLRLQACGKCGAVAYCCKDCQVTHWRAAHKGECSGTQQARAQQAQ